MASILRSSVSFIDARFASTGKVCAHSRYRRIRLLVHHQWINP